MVGEGIDVRGYGRTGKMNAGKVGYGKTGQIRYLDRRLRWEREELGNCTVIRDCCSSNVSSGWGFMVNGIHLTEPFRGHDLIGLVRLFAILTAKTSPSLREHSCTAPVIYPLYYSRENVQGIQSENYEKVSRKIRAR